MRRISTPLATMWPDSSAANVPPTARGRSLSAAVAQGQDEKRCWILFQQERKHLLAYVRRLAPDGCEGVDVLQEVGLRLLRRPDVAVSRDGLAAWCKAVARHIVLHELRAARYERAKLAVLDASPRPDAWESERLAARRSTLLCELERMDRLSREILVRRYVLEQTSNEIAQEINMSSAAVRMRLMRIRDELGAHWTDTAEDDEAGPNSGLRLKLGS